MKLVKGDSILIHQLKNMMKKMLSKKKIKVRWRINLSEKLMIQILKQSLN